MNKNILFTVLAMVILAFMLTGCITFAPTKELVCNTVPADSYLVLCMVAEKMTTTPETFAGFLKIGNVTALASEKYTARQAMDFIDEVEVFLMRAKETGLTYEMAVQAILERYEKLPATIQAPFIIYEDAVTIEAPEITKTKLSDFDWWHIFEHLATQRKIVMPFLIH